MYLTFVKIHANQTLVEIQILVVLKRKGELHVKKQQDPLVILDQNVLLLVALIVFVNQQILITVVAMILIVYKAKYVSLVFVRILRRPSNRRQLPSALTTLLAN